MKFKVGDKIKDIHGHLGIITGLVKIHGSTIDDSTIWYQVAYKGGDLVPEGAFIDILREETLSKHSPSGVKASKSVPYADFVDRLFDSGKLDTPIQEMYWEGGFNEKSMLEIIRNAAKSQNVSLVGEEDFDPEVLKDIYDCTEKGLS